jgi:hypothetical protein
MDEEPRGDEPFWFEEGRTEQFAETFEILLKSCDQERGQFYASEYPEHRSERFQEGPRGHSRRRVQYGGGLRDPAGRPFQAAASGLHSLGDPF